MLIRNIVSRSEIDLNLIKGQFQKMYGKTLSSMIMVRHRFPTLLTACGTDIPETWDAMTDVIGHHPFPVGISHLHWLPCDTFREQEEEKCNYGCIGGACGN